jgi:hypothetical protein
MLQRKISESWVQQTLEASMSLTQDKYGNTIYQKKFDDKLLRIVTSGDIVITLYLTSKMKRYLEGEVKT